MGRCWFYDLFNTHQYSSLFHRIETTSESIEILRYACQNDERNFSRYTDH